MGPHQKGHTWKRVPRACKACRKRKIRCITTTAQVLTKTCNRCLRLGVICEFDERDRVTGRENPSPRPTSRNPTHQTCTSPPNMLQSLSGYSRKEQASHAGGSTPALIVESNESVREPGEPVAEEASNKAFFSRVQNVISRSHIEPTGLGFGDSQGRIGGSYAENNNPVLMALKCIPPPKVTQFLIDIFFRHAQGNNFYVSPREFCDDFVTAGLFSDSVPNASPDFIALVMMILGMGSQFAHLHPGAQKMAAPSGKQELGPGTIFYRKAQALLPLIIIKPGIFSTQVVFLMALFVLQSDLCNLAYIYFGMAIRSAIAIGLHQQGRGNVQISDTQQEIRRRLWWSIYAQERRLSIMLDRPEMIDTDCIDTNFPSVCPEIDDVVAGSNLGNLQENIKLTSLFNRATRTNQMLRLGRSEAHSSLQKLREDMQSWLIELPYHLHTTNLDSNSGCFRGAVHLHMTYNQIFIYLGRLSLLHQTDRSLHRNHQDGHCDTINLESQSFEQSLARSCVVAAYRVAALMRALTDAQKLAKFSFADMSFCTSATVTILLNEFTESHPSYKRTVSFLMQVMEFFALEGLSNAQNTLHFIRGLQRTVDHVKIENLSRTARSESLRNDSHFADESGNISIGLHGYKSNGDKDHDGEANDDDVYEHWQQWTEEQGKNNGLTSPALSPVAAEPSPSLSRGYIVQGESALSSHAEIGPPHMDLMMPAATYTTQEGFVDMNEEQGTWLFPDTESTRNMPATATSPSELPYLSSWLEDLSAFGLSDLRFADDAT